MLETIRSNPWLLAAALVLGGLLAALLVEWIIFRALRVIAARTRTETDDRILATLRKPIFLSLVLLGLIAAIQELSTVSSGQLSVSPGTERWFFELFETLFIVIWSIAIFRIGKILLDAWSRRGSGVVQRQTLPLFRITWVVTVSATSVYALLLVWDIDATGWLASAGVLGIVIGLAAKDSLANLFAGIFILADAPYRLGDYVVLDQGLRGKVTNIGIRSTRVLTLDDIEITVPNSIIGNSTIVNETAGPQKTRHRAAVSCAYGSDIDQVREVLLRSAADVEHVATNPEPVVRFRSFGDSGLNFELLFWISDGRYRGVVIDQLNERIYKAFAQAKIQIPFPQRDVYIKQHVST